MQKIILRLALVVIVIASLFASTNQVQALPGSSWQTGIKIQNLDATATAYLSISLYPPNGNGGTATATIDTTASGSALTAAPSKSVELFLPNYDSSKIGAGTFSAMVSSNVNISAIVTNTNYQYGMADSYNSMQPNTNVSIPYVYHNHNNWSTEIFIQNTSASASAVGTITFTEPATSVSAGDGLASKVVNLNIPPSGTADIDTSTSQYADLNWFIGAASIKITNSIPVAVEVNEFRVVGAGDAQGNVMISSRGLTTEDAGSRIAIPSLYKEFSGASGTWRSGIKIQNPNATGSPQAKVKVTFTSDPDAAAFTGVKTITLNPGDTNELYLGSVTLDNGQPIPNMFKGSAVIDSTDASGTNPVNVVATVQHTNYDGASGYGVAMGYTGFASGASEIGLPTLYLWPSGAGTWVSGIKIQNLDKSAPTYVDITFTADPDSGSKVTGTITNLAISPNSTVEKYFSNPILDGGGSIPMAWKGSAKITIHSGPTNSIAATVINTNYGRHVATMYSGVPFTVAP